MNLKEAFRYMNFLDDLLNEAIEFLSEESFVTNTKEIHLKSKVNPDAEDEVFENVNQVVDTNCEILDDDDIDYDDVDVDDSLNFDFSDFEDDFDI